MAEMETGWNEFSMSGFSLFPVCYRRTSVMLLATNKPPSPLNDRISRPSDQGPCIKLYLAFISVKCIHNNRITRAFFYGTLKVEDEWLSQNRLYSVSTQQKTHSLITRGFWPCEKTHHDTHICTNWMECLFIQHLTWFLLLLQDQVTVQWCKHLSYDGQSWDRSPSANHGFITLIYILAEWDMSVFIECIYYLGIFLFTVTGPRHSPMV